MGRYEGIDVDGIIVLIATEEKKILEKVNDTQNYMNFLMHELTERG